MKKLMLIVLMLALTSCAYKVKMGDCIELTIKESGATAVIEVLAVEGDVVIASFNGMPQIMPKADFEKYTNLYMKKNDTPFSAKKVECKKGE